MVGAGVSTLAPLALAADGAVGTADLLGFGPPQPATSKLAAKASIRFTSPCRWVQRPMDLQRFDRCRTNPFQRLSDLIAGRTRPAAALDQPVVTNCFRPMTMYQRSQGCLEFLGLRWRLRTARGCFDADPTP